MKGKCAITEGVWVNGWMDGCLRVASLLMMTSSLKGMSQQRRRRKRRRMPTMIYVYTCMHAYIHTYNRAGGGNAYDSECTHIILFSYKRTLKYLCGCLEGKVRNYLSICLFIHPSVCLIYHLSIHPSIYLSMYHPSVSSCTTVDLTSRIH